MDRDGVINHRIVGDYVRSVEQFDLLPGVLEGLALLARHAGRIIVVSNQAGVGKGLYTDSDVRAVHDFLVTQVEASGGRIDAALYCPHRADEHCACRKPGTGLAVQAMERFEDLDLAAAVMIGDSAGDIGFARRLGIPSVLVVGTGGEGTASDGPTAVAGNLMEVAHLLTGQEPGVTL